MSNEALIYASVFRRCGVKPQVFDFQNRRPSVKYEPSENEILLQWKKGTPHVTGQYMVTVKTDGMRFVTKDWWNGKSWDNFEMKEIKAWIPKKDITPYQGCPLRSFGSRQHGRVHGCVRGFSFSRRPC